MQRKLITSQFKEPFATTAITLPMCLAPIVQDVLKEIAKAESKFPGFAKNLPHAGLVLSEEAGEIARAIVQLYDEGGNVQEVYKEAVQTIGVCLRLIVNLPSLIAQEEPINE